jgi:glycosyltransferase involved in cell wall biosynthesis
MRSCQLLAVSSLWEGMPNVILEAMAVGLPVVTTPVEGTDELIQHGRTGALATAGGVQGFAAELERMLGSPQWRETFAGAAQQQVRQANTWDAVAAGYAALFTRLLS